MEVKTPNWNSYYPRQTTVEDDRWEHLFDYESVRYYLLLTTKETANCVENDVLLSIASAARNDDFDSLDEALLKCLDLFWPFIHSLSEDLKNQSIVRLQLQTIDGVLTLTNPEKQSFSNIDRIQNVFDDVKVVSSEHIVRVSEIHFQMFKVRLKDSPEFYCMKTVQRHGDRDCFAREIETLKQNGSHPNVIQLVGVVEVANNEIEGILLPFISGRSLSEITHASADQKTKWKKQVRDAVGHLHSKNLVWGDAKPQNVMVDDEENAILIDFEGGNTSRWVDSDIGGTKAGDMQGLQRICELINQLGADQ